MAVTAARARSTALNLPCAPPVTATVAAALPSAAGYVGLLGARKRLPERLAPLRAAGFSEARLQQLHAPIGLDIGGKAPWEVALSVIGEITALRHARLPAAPRQPASISSPQGLAKA